MVTIVATKECTSEALCIW